MTALDLRMPGPTPGFGRILLFLIGVAVFGMAIAGDAYEIRNGTFSNGGAVVEGADSTLIFTVGEAAAGTMSSSSYRISGGFAATLSERDLQVDETFFRNGFETP